MKNVVTRTAEHVSEGHPDKFCDQVADRILDEVLKLAEEVPGSRTKVRTAIECLAKGKMLTVSGEVNLPLEIWSRLNVAALAREVWTRIGYGSSGVELNVFDDIHTQSVEIAIGDGKGVDLGDRAGDQGIMVGYATKETDELMPREWVYARDICLKLTELRKNGTLPWLKSDCKSQVTIDAGGEITTVIVAAQHSADVSKDVIDAEILSQVIKKVLPTAPKRYVINGTGVFLTGGPIADAGVVGRKIVVDAYGPRVAVGGGAYSGKDPTKVDRSAAYMARHIAKTIVAEGIKGAEECLVTLAYGIGQLQPEMVTAVIQNGDDIASWVHECFPDLSPGAIIERFGLRQPNGWSYSDTAAYGHYGRDIFPWEKVKS
jgi:S-adenosylmethionine synthetase